MFLKEYEDYSERGARIFENLSSDLRRILPDARIEHIGSSSVVGSLSKGDLDVFVGVDQAHFSASLAPIKKLDFYEKEGTFRSNQLCMLITDKYHYDVAIQLIANGSDFEMFLWFRDKLRADKHLVQQYNQVKRLAQSLSESEYREAKGQFIEKVLST